MKYVIATISIAAATLAAAFGWSAISQKKASATVATNPPSVQQENWQSSNILAPIDAMTFVDRRTLGVMDMVKTPATPQGNVVAGVVNHHVLATDILAKFWNGLAQARPDATRIIILSPDHFFQGSTAVSVHERTYRTDFGNVLVDTSSTTVLAHLPFVHVENGVMFEKEHGVGALIPFMKQTFPHAQVVPIAIRSSIDLQDARTLGDAIATLRDAHTLIVVSSDMSHYLDEKTALKNDETTLAWLKSDDAKQLAAATDDFTDSGKSFVTLFEALKKEKLQFTLWAHGISTEYGGPRDKTTSYLSGVWTSADLHT